MSAALRQAAVDLRGAMVGAVIGALMSCGVHGVVFAVRVWVLRRRAQRERMIG